MLFTVLVMVMVFCSMTVSASHLDDMAVDSAATEIAHMAMGHDGDHHGSQNGKDVPHNCCSAHCASVKPAHTDFTVTDVRAYSSVVHAAYKGDVVPNQFLQGLFRPPRPLV